MDDRARLFFLVLAGGLGFGVLGAAFGAVTGAVSWKNGRAAGTALGLGVARAFARLSEDEFSPAWKGALVGGTDGLAFLGVVGTAIGYLAGREGVGWRVLPTAFLAAVLLAAGAIALGLLAYVLLAGGSRAVAGLFVGGALGAVGGLAVARLDGLVVGAVAGAAVGALAVTGWR
jgi:hypothetical protein